MKIHPMTWGTALISLGILGPVQAGQVTWTPPMPLLSETLRISVDSAVPPDVLHWGVNGSKSAWETPPPECLPANTQPTDSTAVNSPFTQQDEQGVWYIDLGPFDASTQLIHTVRFVIRLKDGSWLNNQGDNFSVEVSAGRVRFHPENPSVHDPVVVEILDSPGPGILRWGINESLAGGWHPPEAAYQPAGTVPTEDGRAVETPFPAPNDQGISSLTLGPFDRGEQVVTSLHAVVRWGSEWDTESGRNYNLALHLPTPEESAFPLTVTMPNPIIRGLPGQNLTFQTDAPRAEVWIDGQLVSPGQDGAYPLHALPYGPHTITVRAERDQNVALQTTTLWVQPDIVTGEPAGPIAFGGHPVGDGRVRFALYAPGKRFVSLIGDFNGWNPTSHFMNVTTDGTWWIDMAITPGTYRYQYRIEGDRVVGDPYAHEVSWRDSSGKPGWKPEDAKAVLRLDAPPYVWSSPPYSRPSLDNLLIYEFHIGDMQEDGYLGMIEYLDYIKDLGFTALGPMPFTEFAGDHSWGYNPSYYLAPEASYGTPDELKALIDAAHARGLAVIMDIVLNHADYASALYQLYGNDYEASPYFRLYDGENWGFPDIDQTSPAWKTHVADLLSWWLTEYRIDGFRYDATRFTEWSGYNDWGAGWFAYAGKQADPGSIHISEHLPEDPALQRETEMDTTWHAHFRWRIREMLENASLDPNHFMDVLDPTRLGFASALERIAYTESHDEERVMRLLTEKGYPGEEAVRRAEAAMGLTLTAPGPVMIYAGQEFGENTRKLVGHNPIQWALKETPDGKRLYHFTRTMARLRSTEPSLQSTEITFLMEGLPPDVGGYLRTSRQGKPVAVMVNFGSAEARIPITQFPQAPWQNVITGQPLHEEVLLLPGEILVAMPAE